MGTTATKAVIKYWRPQDPNTIKCCVTAKFDEYNTISTDGKLLPGSKLSQGELKITRIMKSLYQSIIKNIRY